MSRTLGFFLGWFEAKEWEIYIFFMFLYGTWKIHSIFLDPVTIKVIYAFVSKLLVIIIS